MCLSANTQGPVGQAQFFVSNRVFFLFVSVYYFFYRRLSVVNIGMVPWVHIWQRNSQRSRLPALSVVHKDGRNKKDDRYYLNEVKTSLLSRTSFIWTFVHGLHCQLDNAFWLLLTIQALWLMNDSKIIRFFSVLAVLLSFYSIKLIMIFRCPGFSMIFDQAHYIKVFCLEKAGSSKSIICIIIHSFIKIFVRSSDGYKRTGTNLQTHSTFCRRTLDGLQDDESTYCIN